MSTSTEKGKNLEQRIARFLVSQDYKVQTNVLLQGRSGARHEVDVLAEKSDGLTTYRLAVECKSRGTPIEKDVVYKLANIMADTGLAKGLVVATTGWRLGAEQAARQLCIDLWGTEELRKYLGRVGAAELSMGEPLGSPSMRVGPAIAFSLSEKAARKAVEFERRGPLGIGEEKPLWFGSAWLPIHVVQLVTTITTGRLKKVSQAVRAWNCYEALSGSLLLTAHEAIPFSQIALGPHCVQPRLSEQRTASKLLKAFDRWCEVSTPAAKGRYQSALQELGIRLPLSTLTVENVSAAHFPVYVALLVRKGHERVVAINGRDGSMMRRLGEVLTGDVGWLYDSLSIEKPDRK